MSDDEDSAYSAGYDSGYDAGYDAGWADGHNAAVANMLVLREQTEREPQSPA